MADSKEEINYWRIISLLYKVAPSAVRVKFDKEFHPTNGLETALREGKWRVLEPLKRKRIINQVQWDLMYPTSGEASSKTFDLTLMICLLRHLASIDVGDKLPHPSVISEAADLSRLKYYRNKFGHHDGCILTFKDFELNWSDIWQAIHGLGGPQFTQICQDVKDMTLNNNDKEILIEIRNLEKSSTFVPKALQKIHEDLINEWGNEDNKVVKTRAISRIEELLKSTDVVVAVGPSGCGKSTAIHHVALRLHNKEGYNIVPVHSPEDIIQYCEPKYKQVFVIDDVCGKSTIDIGLVNRWTTLAINIKQVIEDHKIKILLSCRKHIYLDRSFAGVELLSEKACDFVSDYSLTEIERNQIAKIYLTGSEINAIKQSRLVEKFSFFPLLCSLYSKQKLTGVQNFFANPISVIRRDLELLRKTTDQTTLATMSLFIAYNNSLDENVLSRSHDMTELLEAISDHFDLKARFSIKVVKSELHKLEMSYVKKTVSTYRILHDKIYDIFLAFCGEHFFDLVLEVAHKNVIHERFLLESIHNENQNLKKNENDIKVSDIEENHYFERILKDIQKGFIKDIFLNRQLKCLSFRNKLFQYLRLKVDLKKVLLDVSSEDLSNILLSLARQCYWDMVPILLTDHVDVNVRDWKGTPLYYAVEKGNIDIAKVLLENQADPNMKGWLERGSQTTPLKVAVDNGNVDVVKLLLAHHADTNVYNNVKDTNVYNNVKDTNVYIYNVKVNYSKTEPLLHTALKQKNDSITKLLLDHQADCNVFDTLDRTPLHVASIKGDIDMIKILLDYKAEFNIKNKKGETPLFQAVGENHTDVVKLLLDHNSDHNICNDQNISPLFAASENGHIDIVRLLLEHSCDPNTCKNISPVYTAFSDERADIVRLLLEHTCYPNSCMICSDTNISPVFAASKNGHIDIVRLLLQHNCDPYMCMICNLLKISALHAASANGRVDIVKLLLERQRDPNICNVKNISPLFPVSENGHTDVVQVLLKLNNKSAVFLDFTKEHTNNIMLFLERNCDLNICNTRNESALFVATKKRHTEIVKLLLEHKCDPNVCNDRTESPLFIASREGHADIVTLLLEHKCDPNICNSRNESPLFIASREGHADIVTLFLEHKCDPNICTDENESPLFIASLCYSSSTFRHANHSYIKIVRLLLEYKCDPNICNIKNESPLFIASEKGHADIVTLLLLHKCDPNICNYITKTSPLFIASKKGHAGIVTLLLEHKCDPNICNYRNESPLFIASREGHAGIVTLFLEHKCDPNICNNRNESPLFIACARGLTDIVKLLLKHKCDPNICNDRKKSPLFIASEEGHADIVTLLLEHKCDPYICNDRTESPLFTASWKGYATIVTLLLEHKCDPNIGHDTNTSPLFVASQNGYATIVTLLLENKCDPTICDSGRHSPLSIASKKGHADIVKLLVEHKCDPHICKDATESPLFIASKEGHADIVTLLLEHKCDPYICNDQKESPLFIASKEGHADIVKLLLEHKCDPNICTSRTESPLFIASKEGHADIVTLLLEHKSDANVCNDQKESPLFIASKEGHADIVTLLLEHKM